MVDLDADHRRERERAKQERERERRRLAEGAWKVLLGKNVALAPRDLARAAVQAADAFMTEIEK